MIPACLSEDLPFWPEREDLSDEFMRLLAAAQEGGATIAECLMIARQVRRGDELTWYRPGLSDLSGHLFQVAVWIAISFFGVFRFLSYIDRRIRLEGWELELRLKEAGRGMEVRVH